VLRSYKVHRNDSARTAAEVATRLDDQVVRPVAN